MPIVFTSAIALNDQGRDRSGFWGAGRLVSGLSQTPQIPFGAMTRTKRVAQLACKLC